MIYASGIGIFSNGIWVGFGDFLWDNIELDLNDLEDSTPELG